MANNIYALRYISNKIHGPEGWKCTDMENEQCNSADLECEDTYYACG